MKKMFALTLLLAFIICLGTVLFIHYLHKPEPATSHTHGENDIGVLEIRPLSSPASAEDDYLGSVDDGFTVSEYYVGFTNLDTVYDLLTLQAISELSSEAASYLNKHGFGDVHTLTVLEDSIIFDKSYPFFICQLENVNGTCLGVRYDVKSMQFSFDLSSL